MYTSIIYSLNRVALCCNVDGALVIGLNRVLYQVCNPEVVALEVATLCVSAFPSDVDLGIAVAVVFGIVTCRDETVSLSALGSQPVEFKLLAILEGAHFLDALVVPFHLGYFA